jgi:iron complex transport system ATP-binding protein
VLLSAGNVSFWYSRPARSPAGTPNVIDDISLDVVRGEAVGILGPNGSGKTTLLRLLSGSLAPAQGRITLDGREIGGVSRREIARRIAVVPQETSLAFDYTVLEIVLMGRYPHLGTFEVEGPRDLEAARTALDSTGTAALSERPFRTLSGGEKQRVIIASALSQIDDANPAGSDKVLVLDEPTASLDLKYQFEIGALLRRIHEERSITLLLSTHDLRFAASLCSRLVLLAEGRVLADGPPREVLTPELVGRLFDIEPAVAAPVLAAAIATR